MAHLHARGRRKIVQVLNYRDSLINRGRRQGLAEAQRELGLPCDPQRDTIVSEGYWDVTRREHIAICDELLARDADAVLADDDFCAALLIRELTARGRRVPDDLAVVGWGNETVARFFVPAITTVDYRMAEIAETVMNMLTVMIESPEPSEPRSVTIRPQLLVASRPDHLRFPI